jgi:broad specificity phosphatase PhoE
MKHMFVIKTQESVWGPAGRFESLADTPLSEEGLVQAHRVAKQLVPHEPTAIYTSDGDTERQIARILGKELKLKPQFDADLAEIDFGLWQGLTIEELSRRQPKLCRQWLETPASAMPSGGEAVVDAQHRICRAVRRILKRVRSDRPILLLRPVVQALLCCRLENAHLDDAWTYSITDPPWKEYTLFPEQLGRKKE